MRRLFWVGVGVAATVGTLRAARRVVDEHVPAGARSALGAAAELSAVVTRAREELRSATAQREAELRADLLAGADPDRSRATVDAWRAQRSARAGAADGADATAAPGASGRPATRGSHRAEDPEDGPQGYSFY